MMKIKNTPKNIFTFYYIYIKTHQIEQETSWFKNLHSTIFILKLKKYESLVNLTEFTFYYIYIKTTTIKEIIDTIVKFTFYYIYIKT